MALLQLMRRHREALGGEWAVVHVDHGLRPESAEEARFVEDKACEAGFEYFSHCLAMDHNATASEASLREKRQQAFAQTAEAWQADGIFLAHHQDDLAETLLMRLMDGAGPTGLSGVRVREQVGNLTFYRPLLGLRRGALHEWLRANGGCWHEDPSNRDEYYERNWVRHRLLPLLSERGGDDVVGRIARSAGLIDNERCAMSEACALLLSQLADTGPAPILARLRLKHPLWSEAEESLQRQLLRDWFWRYSGASYPPGHGALEALFDFVATPGPAGRCLRSSGGFQVVHLRHGLLLFSAVCDESQRIAACEPYMPDGKARL